MTTYAEQLDGARKAVAEIRAIFERHGGLPVDLADQLGAAGRDTRQWFERFSAVASAVDPSLTAARVELQDPAPLDEVWARTVAAIATFRSCTHIRQAPRAPQLMVARMAVRRLDCRRCAATIVKPPAGEDDRCDWCGRRGITTFWPVSYALGHMLAYGDACEDCQAALVPESVR